MQFNIIRIYCYYDDDYDDHHPSPIHFHFLVIGSSRFLSNQSSAIYLRSSALSADPISFSCRAKVLYKPFISFNLQ